MRAGQRAMHPDGLVSLRYLLLNGIGVHAIDELNARDDPGEQLRSVETAPVFLGDTHQLEDHAQRRQARTTALGLPGAMPDAGEG